MIDDKADEPFHPFHERALHQTLIDRYGLSHDSLRQIRETMQSKQMSFRDAILHEGLLTPEEIDDALSTFRRSTADNNPSLIETAVRRRIAASAGRLVIRHSPRVKPGPRVLLAHNPDSVRSEAIRALRTELLLLNDTPGQAIVVALVSPGHAEGRSQLAAELAFAFGQLGRRTLLVDADLRRPSQHTLFPTDNAAGLAEALANGDSPNLRTVDGLPFMSVLTAGAVPPNPLELLSDRRFGRLTDSWRNEYEFIIVDTPPVGPYADALAVATLAGRVLVVSRSEATSFREMKDMMRRLTATQSTVLGAVINSF